MKMAMAMAPRRTLLGGRGDVAGRALRAAACFSTASSTTSTIPRAACAAAVASSRLPLLLPRTPRSLATTTLHLQQRQAGTTIRWSSSDSDSASAGSSSNKIWTFEEIRDLTTSTTKPHVAIIDVREPGELASTGRIPGAINIPVTSAPEYIAHASAEDFEDKFGFQRPAPDAEVLFYCKAGVRSRAAAGIARDAGWTKVGEYPGSWVDWVGKGGKVER